MAWEIALSLSIFIVAIIFAILSQTIYDDDKNRLNRPIKFILFFIAFVFILIGLHVNFPIIEANNATMTASVQDSLEQHISLSYYIAGIIFVLLLIYYIYLFMYGVIKKTAIQDDEDEDY